MAVVQLVEHLPSKQVVAGSSPVSHSTSGRSSEEERVPWAHEAEISKFSARTIRRYKMDFKVPKGEILWMQYLGKDHQPKYIVTSKPLRDMYFLYHVDGDKLVKKGKSKDPSELDKAALKDL